MLRSLPLVFTAFLVIAVCTVQSLTHHKGKTIRSRKSYEYNETRSVLFFPDPHKEGAVVEARMERNPNISTKNEPCVDIFWVIYTPGNLDQPYLISKPEDLIYFPECFDLNFFLLIHGFASDWTSNPAQRSTLEAMMANKDYAACIIVTDWSTYAAAPYYTTAAESTDLVGYCCSCLLDYLVHNFGVNPAQFHLVGFSLGAHAVGNTGWYCKNYWGFEIPHCTALDPAGPMIMEWHPDWRLDETDCAYVEALHTCGGYLGCMETLGHVDFYPQGGTPVQKQCSWYEDMAAFACSHSAACSIYTESLTGPSSKTTYYTAHPCDSLQAVEDNSCQMEQQYPMTFPAKNLPNGIYYGVPPS